VQPAMRHRESKVTGAMKAPLYRDTLVRLVIDAPDSPEHRDWMRSFKDRWKARLEQLELWLVSYSIEVD
jgi:hypothetical protein